MAALTSGTGALLGTYQYTPWGQVVSSTSGLPAQPLRWGCRELDETGLYYLRGRYYDASTGRFLSEDPGGLAASLNLYTFALNNPLGMVDPYGACGRDWMNDVSDFIAGYTGMGGDPKIPDFYAWTGSLMGVGSGIDPNSSAYHSGCQWSDAMSQAYDKTSMVAGPTGALLEAGAGGDAVFFHGTDPDSALHLLNGGALDSAVAAGKKIDGPTGFFLADAEDAAHFFGSRRGDYAVLEYKVSPDALGELKAVGADFRPIPQGKGTNIPGNELHVPDSAYPTFNRLVDTGKITVRPR